jgi:DNA-binding winged helix-turn-helix (wHTH) protein
MYKIKGERRNMVGKSELTRYRVADLLVEPGRGQVTRGEERVPLPKLSFELLLVLIKEAPNLVTIDTLIDRVWRGLVVSPETVIQRVKLLRDALGDDPKSPRYVGSIRGWGYQLIATVERLPIESSSPRVSAAPAVAGASGAVTGKNVVQLGDCFYDRAAHSLLRAGAPVRLEPKMYDVLDVLIERSPSVVSNRELEDLLRCGTSAGRLDIQSLLSELQALLGDSAREASVIRNVNDLGFAFCAELRHFGPRVVPTVAIKLSWRGQQFELGDGEHILGRGDECTLVIDGDTVSRRHARLIIRQRQAMIEDLGSKNGTHVDGVEIHGLTRLENGSRVSLGHEPCTIQLRHAATVTVAVDAKRPKK